MPDWAGREDFERHIGKWRHLGAVDFPNGARAVGPRRDLALDGYMFWTYAPPTSAEFEAAEARLAHRIPELLRPFFEYTNGALIFGVVSIDGVLADTARELHNPQPVDIWIGNILRPSGGFVFGSMASWSASAKLCIWATGEVGLVDEADLTKVLVRWPDFDTFVASEMDRLSALHDEHGEFRGTYADRLPPGAQHIEREKPNERPH